MQSFSLSANVSRAWRAYERQLARRPVPTQMTTSAILWGLGDVLAQKAAERRPVLDRRRVALTATFGMGFMGPVGHFWYLGLDSWVARAFRMGTPGFLAAKVFADSAILGPIYVLAFYAWGSFMIDQSGMQGLKSKIMKDFIPTYTAELCFWPAFQTFNFTRVPVEHQLLAVNVMTLVDASFLSWARCQDDWVATVMTAVGLKSLAGSGSHSKSSQLLAGEAGGGGGGGTAGGAAAAVLSISKPGTVKH